MNTTDILLSLLIALTGGIAKVFYDKLSTLESKIETIMVSDVSHAKDIVQLQKDYEDHEARISDLEESCK